MSSLTVRGRSLENRLSESIYAVFKRNYCETKTRGMETVMMVRVAVVGKVH